MRPGRLMSKFLQVFYFICYGFAALAIAFMVPKVFPETPRGVAWLAGCVVFLAGALMHEIASRCYQASLARHRLAVLHRAYVEAMDDLDRLAVDVRSLKRLLAGEAAHHEPYLPSATPEEASAPAPAEVPWPDPVPETEQSEDDTGFRERSFEPPLAAADEAEPGADISSPEGRLQQDLLRRLYTSPSGQGADGPDDSHATVVSGSLIERETLNAVRDALKERQIDLFVQPVVTLPQRKERHLDCDVRINSGGGDFMPPALYNEILRANGLMQPVDEMFLFRTVQLVSDMPSREPGSYAFCRILPDSLADNAFFGAFTDYLRGNEDLVSSVAFEFREADLIDLDEAGAGALGALVDQGFNLCVSQLHNFDVEADRLVEGGVRFVKVDAEMLIPALGDEAEAARIRRLRSGLDDAGIDLIVTGVANEQLLVELLDFDIEFGQGPLFGDPRKVGQASAVADEGRRGRA